MMILREYRNDDFEAIFALDEACFAPQFRFSRASMRRFVDSRRARTTVAEEGGLVVGFCIVHMEPASGGSVGYVVTLDVAPEWRRQGVAAALLTKGEQQATEEGCRSLLLHVSVDNTESIGFYEALGWTKTHTVEDFYSPGLHAFSYRKRLVQSGVIAAWKP